MREELEHLLTKAIHEAFGEMAFPKGLLAVPERPELGDYASSVALRIAKEKKRPPVEIAEALAGKIREVNNPLVVSVEVIPPGFLNFRLSDRILAGVLGKILSDSSAWGTIGDGAGRRVIVEYFQLNIAKRPHVGHLRSAIIGDALKRMFLAAGYAVSSDTHVGDWGTQFGILLLGYKERLSKGEDVRQSENVLEALEEMYRAENEGIKQNPERREAAKQEFAKLEQGDAENRAIWKWMVEVSMQKLEESAKRLGLLPFDEHRGESSYEDMMMALVAHALEKNVAIKKSDGAVVVDLTAEDLDEAVLIKSDGASTYILRDLATIKYRKDKWQFAKNVYVVDTRQSHHFRQLFRVAERLEYEGVNESVHVEFGFLKLPEGMMSSRAGNVIFLDAVLDEAIRRARAAIQKKNPELANADRAAEAVGLGALKYFDLSRHRKSDITFRWDEALSFDGDTGPYLQYTHARLKSILRKVGAVPADISNYHDVEVSPLEHQILVSILRLPEALHDALEDCMPHVLAHYLYELAKTANEFYHAHPVAQETDEAKRAFRVALVSLAALTLSRGLSLLGIEAPEEM